MLTVLLPENRYSPPLRELLEPLLPEGSVFRDPDAGLEGLTGQRLLFAVALDEGGDLLARQLISALNMNKSFFLPPHFCLLETANERGSLVKLPHIADEAAQFAQRMMKN